MTITAFLGDEAIASGPAAEVLRRAEEDYGADPGIRAYDDETGRVADLPFRGAAPPSASPPPPRGRPKLGVVPREVTLLPRHWEWLAGQPGGASAALRRLVEEARKGPRDARARRDAAYRFMADRCGDRPGYEEALRALYRDDRERFDALVAAWPADVRDYIARLLG